MLTPDQIDDLDDYYRELVNDCGVAEPWRIRKAIVRRAREVANPHLEDADKKKLEKFLRDRELWNVHRDADHNLNPNATHN